VSHLLAGGYRHVACITGPLTTTTGYQRHVGYCKALHEAGWPWTTRWCVWRLPRARWSAGYAGAVGPGRTPDAVFVANHLMTIGVLQAIAEAKLDIPPTSPSSASMTCPGPHYCSHHSRRCSAGLRPGSGECPAALEPTGGLHRRRQDGHVVALVACQRELITEISRCRPAPLRRPCKSEVCSGQVRERNYVMLKNINPLLTPELLSVLARWATVTNWRLPTPTSRRECGARTSHGGRYRLLELPCRRWWVPSSRLTSR